MHKIKNIKIFFYFIIMSKKHVTFSEKVDVKIIDNNETIRWNVFKSLFYEYLPYILIAILGIIILYFIYKNRITISTMQSPLYTKFTDKTMSKL